jgi:acyl carrier protein
MNLPKVALEFLNNKAKAIHAAQPNADDDLFKMGILDSFAIVDFITILEEECEINVPDVDVIATNFQSISAIKHYIESRKV